LQTIEWENVEPYEQHLLERNVSIDEAKLFDQYGNGLLFHMTQPTSRSTIKAIARSKPTISEH